MKKNKQIWPFLVLYALAYGAVMLSMEGIQFYEPSPYHRYQAEALLHGHLYLADSITAMQPGLVWCNGYVQHVWGLGIGLWLLPFEALWRLFSVSPCPDRIILGITFALLAFFSGCTGLKLVKRGQKNVGHAMMWVVVFCPALWTLARASQSVFEETVLYSIILSLGILVSLIRVVSFASRLDYLQCCFLASYAIWVRPTHGVYGLSAILLASAAVWLRRRNACEIILGLTVWAASLVLLGWTNAVRFGSPIEFGHHLTVSSGTMMYMTRFGNPCREASIFQAAKELFGLLFLSNPMGVNAFSDNLFPGQSPFTRWRRLDLTTFDLSYFILAMACIVVAVLWLRRQRKKNQSREPESLLPMSLLLWSAFSTAALFYFYLDYPAMASRYLLDFAPAFTGFAMLICVLLPANWARISLPLITLWLVGEIAFAKVPVEERRFQQPVQLALPRTQGEPLEDFGGIYTPDNNPIQTGIAGNGYGWDAESGIASDVVSLAVDKPQFVELHLSQRRRSNGKIMGEDSYLAQMDGVPLPSSEVVSKEYGLIVRFVVPENLRTRQQYEMLFLCFSSSYSTADRDSERYLYSVRWR